MNAISIGILIGELSFLNSIFSSYSIKYLTFKVFDEDTVSDDVIGQVTFIADLYVNSRKPAVYQLNAPWNHASITITPVLDTLKK